MSILVLLASFALVRQTVGSGVIFTECDTSQCGGKEPTHPPIESSNVSFRMECLIRCLEHDFCGFVGQKEEQCHLYYFTDPTYSMKTSAEEWRFWTRPDPCDSYPCFNYGCCRQHRDSFICLCTTYYAGERCEKQVDCASSPCLNGASCVMGDTFQCNCPPGYDGTRCEHTI